ncbi:MAG: hypothetical protein FJX31_02405 [Alphaproteobacteria bacterium]|nr:hypothetical protein [Alphaproteobacteria bacterium]
MVYSGVGHAPPRNAASLVATGLIVMAEFAHFNRDEEEFPMTEDRLLIEGMAELNQTIMIKEENQPLHITAKAA